jgi:hypothetical protein
MEGTFQTVTSSPYLMPVIAGVAILLLIALIVVVALQMSKGRPAKQLVGPVDLFQPPSVVVVDRASAAASMRGSYSLLFYVRVDAVPDMRASATPLLTWPGVWDLDYNAAQDQMVWTFQQTADSPFPAETETGVLKSVTSQRWHQIGIVLEGRTMELFLNGELQRAYTLNNVPPSANSSITIVAGGIMGQLAYAQVWSRRLTLNEVAKNYVETSDSQGRPYLGPEMLTVLKGFTMPNLFCPSGVCDGDDANKPTANASQMWEFPYA